MYNVCMIFKMTVYGVLRVDSIVRIHTPTHIPTHTHTHAQHIPTHTHAHTLLNGMNINQDNSYDVQQQ